MTGSQQTVGAGDPTGLERPWTEPGAFEVAPGVYRIPLPLALHGLQAVNVYALVDGNGLTLVDGGWARDESLRALESALGSIGSGLPEIGRFLVTHMHGDHYSQAVAVRRLHGTRIGLGQREEPNIAAFMSARATGIMPISEEPRLIRAGASALLEELRGTLVDAAALSNFELPDEWLPDGAVIAVGHRQLEVLSTPGHTQGHVVFRDQAGGVLFAGDHVLPHITPSIGFEPHATKAPLSDFLSSLARVRALPDATLLPAHGPSGASVHRRIDELIDHHEQRFAAVGAVLDAGATLARDVAEGLRWTRRGRRLDELDLFNRSLAVLETLAHLDVMVSRGWITSRTQADGSVSFTR